MTDNKDGVWHDNPKFKRDKNNPMYNLKQGLELLKKHYTSNLNEALKLKKQQEYRDKKNA